MPNFKSELSRVTPISIGLYGMFDGNLYNTHPAHCQREYCWSMEQYQAFMQHAVDCDNIGEIITINVEEHMYIVDGQHRLKAVADFKNDVFPIKDIDTGMEWYYSQICAVDEAFNRRFRRLMCQWRKIDLKEYDEALAEKIYNGYNFGGVKH